MKVLLFTTLLLAGCVTTQSPQWYLYDAGPIEYMLPPDMHRTSARGIDSYVQQFQSDQFVLNFDYGAYAGPGSLDHFSRHDEYQFHTDCSAGEMMLVASYRVDPGAGHRFRYAILASYPNKGLTVFANCKTPADFKVARKIFKTVRFK